MIYRLEYDLESGREARILMSNTHPLLLVAILRVWVRLWAPLPFQEPMNGNIVANYVPNHTPTISLGICEPSMCFASPTLVMVLEAASF